MDTNDFQDGPSLVLVLAVIIGPDDLQFSVFSQSLLYSSQCWFFEWQWQYNGNVIDLPGRSQILIGDATRTSILTINKLRYTDTGNYTCQAKHSTSSANETRKIELHLTGILNRCS